MTRKPIQNQAVNIAGDEKKFQIRGKGVEKGRGTSILHDLAKVIPAVMLDYVDRWKEGQPENHLRVNLVIVKWGPGRFSGFPCEQIH